MSRWLIICLLLTICCQPFVAVANTTAEWCAAPEEVQLLGFVNDLRRSLGLAPLVMSQSLGAAAEHHSQEMADNSYFSHTLLNGVTWSKNLSNHGYTFITYRGENLAAGSSLAWNAFLQWRNSPGHYANMVNKNYRAIGIGHAYNPDSTYDHYWTQTFGGRIDALGCATASAAELPYPQSVAVENPVEVPELIDPVAEEPETTLPNTGTGTTAD